MTTMAGRVCLLLLLLSAVCLINAKAYPKLVANNKRQHQCPPGESKCLTSNTCIRRRYFCDNYNDCEDNSDEDTAFCAAHQCSEDEVRCPNGQCFAKQYICESNLYGFNCADGTPLTVDHCPLTPQRSAMICKGKVVRSCNVQIMNFETLNGTPISTLTDLKAPCRVWQDVYGCLMTQLNDQCTESDRQTLLARYVKTEVDLSQLAKPLEYVCDRHLDVFNDNLACIKAVDDDGVSAIAKQALIDCREFVNAERPYCTSNEMANCVAGVVSEQCGAEIGGHVRPLADELMKVFPSCQTELAMRGFRELLRRKLEHP